MPETIERQKTQTIAGSLETLLRAFGAAPAMIGLRNRLIEDKAAANALAQTESSARIELSGLVGSARAFMIDILARESGRPILFVASDSEDAFALAQDLEQLPVGAGTFHYPALGIAPYDYHLPSGETLGKRISSLAALKNKRAQVVVTPVQALLEPTISPKRLQQEAAFFQVGVDYDFDELTLLLTRLGFRRVANVEEVGDYAQRGGLVDFFSPGAISPVRIEFFGDTVESIRTFDVADQRARGSLGATQLLPRREVYYDSDSIDALLDSISSAEDELIRARCIADPEWPGLEWLAPALGFEQTTLCAHLPENCILITDGRGSLQQQAKDLLEEDARRKRHAQKTYPLLKKIGSYLNEPEMLRSEEVQQTQIDILPFRGANKRVIDFSCKEPPPIAGNMDALASALAAYRLADIAYLIGADNPGQAERITELVHDNFPGEDPPVIVGLFQGGFFCEPAKVALLTDHQIFRRQYRRRMRKRFKEGVALTSYTNLEPGGYVVHTEHGLAKYLKLETLLLDGRHRDCLLLEYAKSDKLYVPIEEFNRVSKYAGKDASPTLTVLGAAGWEKLKARAQKNVTEMAESLVRLYAERKARPGFAFRPDSAWMRKLEASFPYEETEDQQKAIDETKADMESSSPMERLICGDVGFGKTEVAVRAALKCVEEGKQVAVLVPTTILAQQHYITFRERLAEFPVRVDIVSRFRTAKELKATEEAVKSGAVDILIGTHRILNKKVIFRDLGLLVVDEEQRFGVKQKERMREMKANVDTITLTATPIPRTLQMSLSGARDMSLIASSPRGRLPIQTVVSEFTPESIAQAILLEIDRDGQVFFVHNRVQTIEAVKRYIKKLLPQISILVGHGQMPERELENVMLKFVNKEAQVLLCTAIIESGLDIPNVNTIIIDRADRFGMAQLYQLRGRVGRSTEQAYCHLLTPGFRRVTEDAKKRLKAIEAHTELGSGFALAMRDLEIRGAGNLLGAKQSGFIDEIGFDLYTKLLEEAVAELKGDAASRLPDTSLEYDGEAYLPIEYIDINQHKVDLYRRLAQARSAKEVEYLREEMADRYGKPPAAAVDLIEATMIKILAGKLGIEKVRIRSGRVTLIYEAVKQLGRAEIERLRQAIEYDMEFSFSPNAQVTVDLSGLPATERLATLREALTQVISDQ